MTSNSRITQRSKTKLILLIHARTFDDKQFSYFLVTLSSCTMQRSKTKLIFLIYVCTSSNSLFDCFDVSHEGTFVDWR